MITTLIVMAPFALFGLFILAFLVWDKCETITLCKDTPQDKESLVKWYGYDPNSPFVIRFQILAGIKPIYGSYGRNSLRDRFNKVRYTT